MTIHDSAAEIAGAFDEVFDQAVLFHGYADFMRDYDVVIYAAAAPSTGIKPDHRLYRFRHCVRASATTAVRDDVWPKSLDDRLTDYETGVDVDGYVWGVKCQALYPGFRLVGNSREAAEWSKRLGIPMFEAVMETNGHNVRLVFSALEVTVLVDGWSPFVVESGSGPDAKIPLSEGRS